MRPNRKQIEELAINDPLIYGVWKQIQLGMFTYEEGLILMITLLAKQNKERLDTLMKNNSEAPARRVI